MTDSTVLIVTGADDITADLVIEHLHQRGVLAARLDTADFPHEVAFTARYGTSLGGLLETSSRVVDLGKVLSVYWRRPDRPRFGHLDDEAARFAADEAVAGFVSALTAMPCAWVNCPDAIRRAERKPLQLWLAAEAGLRVPDTIITNDLQEAREFARTRPQVVYKPLRPVDIHRDGVPFAIWTSAVDPTTLDGTVAGTAHLFQAAVDKAYDVRLTIVGREVFAVRIDSRDGLLDWRAGYEQLSYRLIDAPAHILRSAGAYLERLGRG